MQSPVDNIKIRLLSVGNPDIRTEVPSIIERDFSSSDLKIQYQVSVVVNRPQSQVDVIVTLTYLNKGDILFSGSLTTSFEVVELASIITIKDGQDEFQIESDFMPMLINIAFGTTRGYFARELQGTVLAPFPFPMITIERLLKRTSFQLK